MIRAIRKSTVRFRNRRVEKMCGSNCIKSNVLAAQTAQQQPSAAMIRTVRYLRLRLRVCCSYGATRATGAHYKVVTVDAIIAKPQLLSKSYGVHST